MIAASECQEKIVEELIKRDCSVNSVTLTKNNTSLLFAAKVSAFLARHGVGRNVNIGRMILKKNHKLINQCNFSGGGQPSVSRDG